MAGSAPRRAALATLMWGATQLSGCKSIVGDYDGPLPEALSCDPKATELESDGSLPYAANGTPCLGVHMEAEDFDALRVSHRFAGEDPFRDLLHQLVTSCGEPFPALYPWFEADLEVGTSTLPRVGIRKKGFLGSVRGHGNLKPSLKFKLDRYVKDQELGTDERLTLNNNAQDLLRFTTCLVYEIFERAEYPAPRCNIVGVMVNGKPAGAYSRVEPLKKRFLRYAFGNDDGSLYEGTLVDFLPSFLSAETPELGRWEAKTGGTQTSGAPLLALQEALDVPDSKLLEALGPHLNVDRFLRFWALEMLTDHRDGYTGNRNNFYLYFDPADGGRGTFIPWGADDALRDASGDLAPRSAEDYVYSELPRRLSRLAEVRTRFMQELEWLLTNVWQEEALLLRADEYATQVLALESPDDYDVELERLQRFIRGRAERLDEWLADGLPPGPASAPNCFAIGLQDGLEKVQTVADGVGTYNTLW